MRWSALLRFSWSVDVAVRWKCLGWKKNFQQVFFDHINFIINFLSLFRSRAPIRSRRVCVCVFNSIGRPFHRRIVLILLSFALYLALWRYFLWLVVYTLNELEQRKKNYSNNKRWRWRQREWNYRRTTACVQIVALRDRRIGTTPYSLIVKEMKLSGYSIWHFFHAHSFLFIVLEAINFYIHILFCIFTERLQNSSLLFRFNRLYLIRSCAWNCNWTSSPVSVGCILYAISRCVGGLCISFFFSSFLSLSFFSSRTFTSANDADDLRKPQQSEQWSMQIRKIKLYLIEAQHWIFAAFDSKSTNVSWKWSK